ncbi:ubiquitin-specific peptidase 2 (C19 family) [Schistosoma japonicum]|nr:ubiquitin-specific peptidase 2 (C19 family) [Schistosoma japonicum]KAH8849365.1 ubiquitin-specific peptidase 2 (C19 family) [Schistosoma japonicum]
MNCRCCLQTEAENTDRSVTVLEENIEDGDILQEIGNAQYTLNFLRQVVQQSTRILDESPPAYEDFDKYPRLSKVPTTVKETVPVKPCTQQPQQFSQLDFDQFVNSSRVSWIGPYPKPQGDPPPPFFNWLRSRFGSLRQSIMSHFSNQSNQLQSSSPFSIHNDSISSGVPVNLDISLPTHVDHSEPMNSMSPTQTDNTADPIGSPITNSKEVCSSSSSSSIHSTLSLVCTPGWQNIIEISSSVSPNCNNNQAADSSCTNESHKSVIINDSDIDQMNKCEVDSQNDHYDDCTDDLNYSMTQ